MGWVDANVTLVDGNANQLLVKGNATGLKYILVLTIPQYWHSMPGGGGGGPAVPLLVETLHMNLYHSYASHTSVIKPPLPPF